MQSRSDLLWYHTLKSAELPFPVQFFLQCSIVNTSDYGIMAIKVEEYFSKNLDDVTLEKFTKVSHSALQQINPLGK